MEQPRCERCGSTEEFWEHICPLYYQCSLDSRPLPKQNSYGVFMSRKEKYITVPVVYGIMEVFLFTWTVGFFITYSIVEFFDKFKMKKSKD